MKEKPLVLVTETCDPEPLAWLQERANVVMSNASDPDFPNHLREARGLLVRTYTKVTDAFLRGVPKLRVVARGGVGLENIDVSACRSRGIEVVYTPDANTLAVGDHVFGVLIQLIRPWKIFPKDRIWSPDEFKSIRNSVRGKQLNELTIGILGMGRVGRRVGQIAAKGFGMRVIYNDLLDVHEMLTFPARSVDKAALYRESDLLSLHVDMHPGNENLVGAKELATMKAGAIVINTSRGEVLDASALAAAIRSGKISGAAIDVYHPEPPGPDFPLIGMDNVILTPHLASRTNTALANMSWVVKDVMAVLEGRDPEHPAPKR